MLYIHPWDMRVKLVLLSWFLYHKTSAPFTWHSWECVQQAFPHNPFICAINADIFLVCCTQISKFPSVLKGQKIVLVLKQLYFVLWEMFCQVGVHCYYICSVESSGVIVRIFAVMLLNFSWVQFHYENTYPSVILKRQTSKSVFDFRYSIHVFSFKRHEWKHSFPSFSLFAATATLYTSNSACKRENKQPNLKTAMLCHLFV